MKSRDIEIVREDVIFRLKENIISRMKILSEACSVVRTLNGVIAMFVESDSKKYLILSLKELQAPWDSDKRPVIQNVLIHYVNFNNYDLIDQNNKIITLNSLSVDELISVNFYFETMVPIKFSKLTETEKSTGRTTENEAKMMSKYEKRINHLRKQCSVLNKSNIRRKKQITQFHNLLSKFLDEKRITKEEIAKFIFKNN